MTRNFLSVLFLGASIAAFVWYIDPTWALSIAEKKTDIAKLDNALAAASQFVDKQNQLLAARSAIPETDLTRLKSFLPDGVDNVQLILDLDALAKRSGVEIRDIAVALPGSLDTKQGTAKTQTKQLPLADMPQGTLTVSLKLLGTYDGFRAFLAGVERSLRLLDVSALSVKDSTTGVYEFSMDLSLYWLR